MIKKIRNSSYVIFIVIAISYIIGDFLWWKINTPIIPEEVSFIHFRDVFENSLLYYNAPLITWITKFMFFVFGKNFFDLQIIFVNYLFFLIPLYFIYKIGLELKNKETGNIAMILFSLVPCVYGLSRQYGHQDYHVMSIVVFNIFCLIKNNNFKDIKWSILYGFSIGIGLLIKDEFLIYFFAPYLFVLIRSLIFNINKKKIIINIITTTIIGLLISGCHYFRIEIIYKILQEPKIQSVPIFSFENIGVITIGLWEQLLSFPLFILFIIGFIWFFMKYKQQNKFLLLLWFFIPWLIMLFMPHHNEPEYCLGFVPMMILIISLWISNINKKYIKLSILIIIVSIYLFQFVTVSYCFCSNIYEKSLFEIGKRKIVFFDNKSKIVYYDKTYNDITKKIVDCLKKYTDSSFNISVTCSSKILSLALINDINIKYMFFNEYINPIKSDFIVYIDYEIDIYYPFNRVVYLVGSFTDEDGQKKLKLYPELWNVFGRYHISEENKGNFKIIENEILTNIFNKLEKNYYLVETYNLQKEKQTLKILKKYL